MRGRGLARTLNSALAAGRFAMRSCVCGFTLIEVLITLSILASIMCLGLFATTDFLRRTSLADARDTLVTLLTHARVASMSDVGGVSHGVCFDPREFGASISVSGLPVCDSGDVFIFTQLSGTTTGAHIVLSQASTSLEIDVDREGAITW
jgi:prepilin-type N-terminal cleavage/methylation domain-containing protein